MTKDVMISIQGLQDYNETGADSIELTTAGKLRRLEEGYELSYEESALTGMEGTLTRFEIQPGRVLLTRSGQLNSEMVFEKGVRHLSLYDTPYGSMMVGVAARKVRSTINDCGGELEINYAIDIDHRLAGENSFSLQVRESHISQ